MHGGGRVGGGEVEGEVLGQGLDGGLAGVVRRVARRVRDALLAARDHHRRRRAPLRRGLDERQQRRDAVDDAEEVRREHLLEAGRVCVREGRARPDAGVEGYEVEGAW